MTNQDLETVFREMSGLSTVAALRYIYSLGYWDGAGVSSPTALHSEPSQSNAAPSTTNRTALKSKITKP